MKKITIVGITGYSGLELFRLLSFHAEAEVVAVCATSHIGEKLADAVPQFEGLTELVISEFDVDLAMKNSDVVFFATSSGVSLKLALPLIEAGFPVIDLSGDFRLKNPDDYEKWYKNTAAENVYLSKAKYNLADLTTATATYIANPGCYATATLLALAPLVQENLIDLTSIIVDAKSGLSGAGKKLTESSHFVDVSDNMSMYKVNQHQHIPEIAQQLHDWNEDFEALQFTTSLIPVTRGIFASSYVKLADSVTFDTVKNAYQKCYENKNFVRIRRQLPQIKDVVGTNFCDIGLVYNEKTNILTIVSVIDNLMKGAAGQAVQNFNQLFGFAETTGLQFMPMI
ncbi:N-acetyl-gamma-glutamyl-phosphate reductase [Lactococcus nasutitermitis]|uniref:N-acetyl-gamma-glutamyl-phosphate reductase n=1 Tax=Lactococcus nasutitermitis TaxID=1652957 RepID=A0ABV9JFP7_9LACT|nr:N-acetyl-gamma-glutamyl-phosphate reductase [Lactococcus nasutitermitis]